MARDEKLPRVRLSADARRAQIVDSAIEVIADDGYAAATFARIARHAGLSSTGLISYHFEEKADLMRAVVAAVYAKGYDYMRPRIEARPTPALMLQEFILASVEFYAAFPKPFAALTAVLGNMRRPDGRPEFGPELNEPQIAQLQRFMRQAQESGEMAPFDTRVAAVTLRAALDGAGLEVSDPDHPDPAGYGRELANLFAAAFGQRSPDADGGGDPDD